MIDYRDRSGPICDFDETEKRKNVSIVHRVLPQTLRDTFKESLRSHAFCPSYSQCPGDHSKRKTHALIHTHIYSHNRETLCIEGGVRLSDDTNGKSLGTRADTSPSLFDFMGHRSHTWIWSREKRTGGNKLSEGFVIRSEATIRRNSSRFGPDKVVHPAVSTVAVKRVPGQSALSLLSLRF